MTEEKKVYQESECDFYVEVVFYHPVTGERHEGEMFKLEFDCRLYTAAHYKGGLVKVGTVDITQFQDLYIKGNK